MDKLYFCQGIYSFSSHLYLSSMTIYFQEKGTFLNHRAPLFFLSYKKQLCDVFKSTKTPFRHDNALLKTLAYSLRPNISLAASDNMGAALFHAGTQTLCQLFGWYFIFQRKVLLHCQTKRKYQYFARASLVVCAIAKKFRKIHFASPTPSIQCTVGRTFQCN